MTATDPSSPPSQPPKVEKAIGWAQRINGEYSSIVRWVALAVLVYGAVRGRVDIMVASAGLGVSPNVVGKPHQ